MLNQITKFRIPGTDMEVALVDWTHKPLFSTADFQNNFTTQKTQLFQYVVGDQVPGVSAAATVVRRTATENDTNLSTPGAMATTEEMLVYAIRAEIYEMTLGSTGDFTSAAISKDGEPVPRATALANLSRFLLLQLQISQKIYADATIGWFNTGFGPSFVSGTAAFVAGGRSGANLGLASNEAVQSFAIPHHMGGQEKFSVDIVNPTGEAVNYAFTDADPPVTQETDMVRIRVWLDGLYKRPVS